MKRILLYALLPLLFVSCDLITKTQTYFVITSHSISVQKHKDISNNSFSLHCDDVQRLVTYVHRTGGPLDYGQVNMTQFLNLFDLKTGLGEKAIPIRVSYIDSITGQSHILDCYSTPPIYGSQSKSLTWHITPINTSQKFPLGTFNAATVLVTLMVDRDSYLFSEQTTQKQ